ncbi:polyprenyl synthetase family protein [Streptomyces tsukubensis]|uniref:Geranylgeranyl pyrophosphate synthase n=1 Tax=Streptomyces tsukubensis TaxID=83656 RepID=A0A1V3ZZJ3_9ACTN|nr:polyprenyl synthetase family protein [Streptomyces tsukubensis]OON71872.1 geranylgeranyl pyrophosphate synthase [Streptomyces tsukubensis]QFR91821.1 polyprenyl synthetase family protein [Streptomyces tsukubensis]
MRRERATTRPSGGPSVTALPTAVAVRSRSRDTVDGDVAGAVGQELEEVLRARVGQAASIDPTFTRDVAERVAHFTLHGGKRLRSQFLWWGLRACGGGSEGQTRSALRIAAGLELIQTCALVHDDVMDGSPLRRGRPAVHTDLATQYGPVRAGEGDVSFGAAGAVLVGDLALVWADDTVAETELDTATRLRVREVWRAMRTEMVAGQYLDLHGQATAVRSVSRAVRAARLKTAMYTVERPLALGAALAGADGPTVRALRSAGRCAGIAFQLRDDLLGLFGDPEVTGKPSGDDIRSGKPTYLVAVALARAEATGDQRCRALLEGALGDGDLSEDDLTRIRAALVATGARDLVTAEINRLVARGHRCLNAISMEPRVLRRLGALLRGVTTPPAAPVEHDQRHAPPVSHGLADATPRSDR